MAIQHPQLSSHDDILKLLLDLKSPPTQTELFIKSNRRKTFNETGKTLLVAWKKKCVLKSKKWLSIKKLHESDSLIIKCKFFHKVSRAPPSSLYNRALFIYSLTTHKGWRVFFSLSIFFSRMGQQDQVTKKILGTKPLIIINHWYEFTFLTCSWLTLISQPPLHRINFDFGAIRKLMSWGSRRWWQQQRRNDDDDDAHWHSTKLEMIFHVHTHIPPMNIFHL